MLIKTIFVIINGDKYFISYTNADAAEQTTTSLAGYTYQAITTAYNATLKPIQSVTAIDNSKSKIPPRSFMLLQNYPNPFNPATTIEYRLSKQTYVKLKVYDILGREVETLVNGEKSAGDYFVTFNAANLPSGIYFYKIDAGKYSLVKKLILLK